MLAVTRILPNWVPKILTGYANSCTSHANHHRHLVVELEGPVVNIDVIESEVIGKVTQKMGHGVSELCQALLTLLNHTLSHYLHFNETLASRQPGSN